MDVLQTIKTRRSCRDFKNKFVEQEKIDMCIEAARFAPTGKNSQSNHFLVIQNKSILKELADLVQTVFSKMEINDNTYSSLKNAINKSKQGGYVFCYNAPVLIIIANQNDYSNNMADCVAATENILIQANALNLGSCYINQLNWLRDDDSILDFLFKLGLEKEERVFSSAVIGYPNTKDGLPDRKIPERHGNKITYIM